MDRMTPLDECIREIGAQQIATHPMKQYAGKGRFDVYVVPKTGRVFVVQVHQLRKNDPESWDVLVPVSASNSIAETLADLKTWAASPVLVG